MSEGLLTTVAWGLGDRTDYALEASVFVTGAAVQWLRDGLGLIASRGRDRAHGGRTRVERRRLLRAGADRPRLASLGSVRARHDRRPDARDRREHLARAALEAIAYQTVDAVEAMEAASGERLAELRADGGATANAWLMQFQADVLGRPVIVPEVAETTALGAAYLAGMGTGAWTLEQVAALWREAARYEPRMSDDERRALLEQWRRAVERSRDWARPRVTGLAAG